MKRAEEVPRLLETVESQQRASHSFPQALGNLAHNARFPHSLSSDDYDRKWETDNTYYRCSPHLRVTFLSDPTDTRLGYLVK